MCQAKRPRCGMSDDLGDSQGRRSAVHADRRTECWEGKGAGLHASPPLQLPPRRRHTIIGQASLLF